jgi:roadblock/LC7 domain-containing protein
VVVAEPSVLILHQRPFAGQVAEAYTGETGRQWTQPIGFVHALFELAVDVMGRVDDSVMAMPWPKPSPHRT